MATQFATPNTLLGATLSDPADGRTQNTRLVSAFAIAFAGSILLAISARVQIPFIPVPATFQTFAVATLAAAFGWRIGLASLALYIVEGLSGLPVFASGGGLGYVMSPTFGFILGWLPMAFVIGYAADKGASKKALPLFAVMVLGDAITFFFGYFWLVMMAGGASWIDQTNVMGSAFNIAVQPFIVWDLLKMALAALTVTGGWALVRGLKK